MKFYREWLPLIKQQFRIMAMLTDKGKFSGSLNDLCDYFSVTRQSKNRSALKAAIVECEAAGLITVNHQGQRWDLEIVPQDEDKAIDIPSEWFRKIRNRPKSEKSISWEALLKAFLWIFANDYEEIVTNNKIADELNISPTAICLAKNILDEEFGAIQRKRVSEKIGEDAFMNKGQHLGGNAFWLEED